MALEPENSRTQKKSSNNINVMNDTSIVLKKKCKLSARVFSLRLYARHLYKYHNGNKQILKYKFSYILNSPLKSMCKKTTTNYIREVHNKIIYCCVYQIMN